MDAPKASMIVAAVAAYKVIRLISRSLRGFHPITVDSSKDDAVPISMDSSCSSSFDITDAPAPATKYEVFLSFKGEDTRDSFTSHLYEALCRAKIQTYIDDNLDKGEEISPVLLRTIEESKICVIIFSKDYASSTWCLDELVKILECKQKYGRAVIPIFYNVDPSTIRKQSGTYGDAFIKHEQRFKNNKHKVQRWKDALTQAANLSGWDSMKLRPESRLIAKVVKDLSKKLNHISSCHFDGLVGIDPHVKNIEALLFLESPDVHTVGIWGMGGIGKTTLAQVVFHKLNAQFESCCFVANVREQIARIGLDKLQDKCLQELLDDQDFGTYSINSTCVKNRLQRKKIFLVLDDVNNSIQVEDLIKVCDWFGLGSRIIVTSRDIQVLKNAGAYVTYHVQEMNFQDALELFSLKAFKQHEPIKNFVELSEQGVKYCHGVPLALKVLGSFLYGRKIEAWESALQKFKKVPYLEIFEVLRLSFDGLDDEQKNIFLDLACFFRGRNKPYVGQIQNYYDLSSFIDIHVLFERSLISVDEHGHIVMHDLVEAIGQEIARQQSINELGKPIQLWEHKDIYHILKNKMGAERIRSMSLDMCKTKKIELSATTFEKMNNMRFLEFFISDSRESSQVHISENIEYLPEELKIFHWDDYPLPSVPLRFCAENLVELRMSDSNLQQLWDGDQHFPNLKLIDVSGSEHLIGLPDLSQAPNIQRIYCEDCVNLVQVHSSDLLVNLRSLHLRCCFKLRCVNIGSSKIHPTSSKLLFVNNYCFCRIPSFIEVSIKVLISQDGNICGFQFKGVMVTFDTSDIDLEEFEFLASSLPFVRKVCWLDFPSSVEIGRQHFETHVDYGKISPIFDAHTFEMKLPDMFEEAKELTHPSMKGTTTKGVVLCLEERMGPENLTVDCEGYYGYNGFSEISNIGRWSLLTRLSLPKSEKVSSCLSKVKSLRLKYKFTLSFNSEWPTSNLTSAYGPEMSITKHFFGDLSFCVGSNWIWFAIPY